MATNEHDEYDLKIELCNKGTFCEVGKMQDNKVMQ